MGLFRGRGITGWRRHQALPGKPDFVFSAERLAVFVDGCFWHGCPRCFVKPKQNAKFWREKIGGNQKRDRRVARQLRADGWSVGRIRECRLKRPEASERRILRMLGRIRGHLKIFAYVLTFVTPMATSIRQNIAIARYCGVDLKFLNTTGSDGV